MSVSRASRFRPTAWLLLAALVGTQLGAVADAAVPPQGVAPVPSPGVLDHVGEPCRFTGRVVDENGRPVPGAVVVHLPDVRTLRAMGIAFGVRFTDAEQARFTRATCDAEGRFALESRFVAASDSEADTWIWARDPSLVVFHSGHAVRAYLCTGLAAGDYDAGNIAIEPGCRLVGRVVDERGQPLAGARIAVDQDGRIRPFSATTADDRGSARLANQFLATSTDASGAFAIDGLWNGSVQLWASADRYSSTSIGSKALVAGTTADCCDIVLSKGERIAGRVEDAAGQPVAGARVFAHPLTAEESMQLDYGGESDAAALGLGCVLKHGPVGEQTDSVGHFELSGLQKRPVQVLVDADGFDMAELREAPPGTDSLVVRLLPEARLDVEVVDATSGQAVTDATVAATRSALFGAPVRLRVDPVVGREGVFSVHQVRADSTWIRVSAPGRGAMILALKAIAPGIVDTCTVRLGWAARITGRLVEAGGVPARGVPLVVWPVGETDQAFAAQTPEDIATDADGRFTFEGLAATRWKVVVRTDRYERLRADVECDAPAGRSVTLPDIVLSRGAVLFGTLSDESGQAVAGRELWAMTSARIADRHRAFTDSAGRYEFAALEPGEWAVVAPEKLDVPLGQTHIGWHDRIELDVSLQPQPRAVVHGRLADDGQAVADGMIVASKVTAAASGDSTIEQVAHVAVRLDGDWELELPPGEYELVGFGADPPRGRTDTLRVRLESGDKLDAALTFVGEPLGVLVRDGRTGDPIAGATVRLTDTDGRDDPWELKTPCWPTTDAAGRAAVPHVVAGDHRLRCDAPGWPSTVVDVTAPSADPQGTVIELLPGGTLAGVLQPAPSGQLPVVVRARRAGTGDFLVLTFVQPDGRFALTNLPPGPCRLVAAKQEAGGETIIGEVSASVVSGEMREVELMAR